MPINHDLVFFDMELGDEVDVVSPEVMFKLRSMGLAHVDEGEFDSEAAFEAGYEVAGYLAKNPGHVVVYVGMETPKARRRTTIYFGGESRDEIAARVRMALVKDA